MANKITKAQMFTMIKALDEVKANPDMVAFIDHELELLAKKSGSKKPTKTQEQNEVLKNVILDTLTKDGVTVSELQTKSDELSGLSNQKISALLKQMVDSGVVIKTMDKKKALFSLAE